MAWQAPALLIAPLIGGSAAAAATAPFPPVTAPAPPAVTCPQDTARAGCPPVVVVAASAAADQQALEAARSAFRALPQRERFDLQVLLAVLGYWSAVANDSFGPKLMAAIQAFQRDLGTAPTGALSGPELSALHASASPLLRLWGLRPVRHPIADATLWVPAGLDLTRATSDDGITLTSQAAGVEILFDAYAGLDPAPLYNALLEDIPRANLHYSTATDDFFVLSIATSDMSRYVRFQKIRGGIVGFALTWPTQSELHGERLSVVMSDLFRANVSLGQARRPPEPIAGTASAASPSEPRSGNDASGRTRTRPPARAEANPEAGGTGSGFVIAPGLVLTNAHVVNGCTEVTTALNGVSGPARVLARDAQADLALVRPNALAAPPARLRIGVRLGEDIAAFGFPLSGMLASSGNFTRGTVTATAGVEDDTRQLQISAPVQPGNSGGPLLDESGNVVGVVVAKLNALKVVAETDDIPQNINFAIKASVVARFLEENGVAYTAAGPGAPLRPADLAALAQSFTVAISCDP